MKLFIVLFMIIIVSMAHSASADAATTHAAHNDRNCNVLIRNNQDQPQLITKIANYSGCATVIKDNKVTGYGKMPGHCGQYAYIGTFREHLTGAELGEFMGHHRCVFRSSDWMWLVE